MDIEFNKKNNEVKAKINIVEVMGKYSNLTRKGNNFLAICPFHEDSTPSLSISQENKFINVFLVVNKETFLFFYKNIKILILLMLLKKQQIMLI